MMDGKKTTYPRVMIAAPQGRSGKTLTSIAICAAFKEMGLAVQPFKKGPDYIDPSWLTAACGRVCRNLDSVLMPERVVMNSFQQSTRGIDIAVIEGAMGLYDGFNAEGYGSAACIARLLSSPVILVVNGSRITRSVAAMVSGYQHFEPGVNIAGVILNYVSGSRHEHKMVTAIERYCGIPVLGSIPRDNGLKITERHLGLIPSVEYNETEATVEHIRKYVAPHINLKAILDIARSAQYIEPVRIGVAEKKSTGIKIGVIRDRVFSFYYPENLEAIVQTGAELVFIDSIKNTRLPDIDGLYIGGGFPEMFLSELEANKDLRKDIAQAIEDYLPVYAECAGLMYLCRSIQGSAGKYEMVGAIPGEIEICPRHQGHGYVAAQVIEDNPWFPVGLTIRGHEFHHSRIHLLEKVRFAYKVQQGSCIDGHVDGILYKNMLASYTHIHASGIPQWAESIVSLVSKRAKTPVVALSK